ncbi:MAG: hypothetical protein ACE5FF_10665, partial [Saprospiraceae bacterium]
MRPVYFYRILLFFAISCLCGAVAAQVVSTDANGRKIIVFSDGSWRYFREGASGGQPAGALRPNAPGFEEHLAQASEAAAVVNQLALELVQERVELAKLEWVLDSLDGAETEPPAALLDEKRKRLRDQEAALEKANEQFRLAKEWATLLAETAYYPPLMRHQKLTGWQKDHGFAGALTLQSALQQAEPAPAAPRPFRFHRPARSQDDLVKHPPAEPCELAFAGKDATTGSFRRDTRSAPLFSKTDKALEASFPASDFIRCDGHLTALSGGFRFLQLDISIATPKAPQLYGYFDKGGMLEFRFLPGGQVRLFNSHPDAGRWDPG